MRTLLIICILMLGPGLSSQTVKSSDPLPMEDITMGRVRELEKVFLSFVKLLHGEDPDKARIHLSDGVLTQINTDHMKTLAKNISGEKKIVTISEKIEYDNARSGLELVRFKYENEPFPYEVLEVVFDKSNHIAFLNSSRPDKAQK